MIDIRQSAGSRPRAWFAAAALTLAAGPALGQDGPRGAAPSLPEPASPETDDGAGPPDRYQLLEDRITELNERLRQSEEDRQKAVSPLTWNGYVDFGGYVPIGNRGVGWVQDFNNAQFPQYSNYSWTFLGDILATAVNSRGEPADLGDAPGVVGTNRFDSVNSDGAPGFIVNEINLRPTYALSESAILRASVNFIPRTGDDFRLGDFIEADLAELEYLLTKDGKTSIFAGKMMPVFGIEYRERKADQRFGITPSLVSRYTTGSQLGLKIRSKLLDDWLVLAAAVTNGSSTIEAFHFYNEIDKNIGKTLNGRAAINIPVGRFIGNSDRLEIGVSGEWGPQDRATDNDGKMWFAGVDLQYLGVGYALKAQVMQGGSPGRAAEGVWGLDLKTSGYVSFDWQVHANFGFYARGDLRDALVTLGAERIYVTKSWRATGGVRWVFNPHMVVKAEYLHNGEYGGIRNFRDDVFTSSLVMSF
jgi:hypothetical protein